MPEIRMRNHIRAAIHLVKSEIDQRPLEFELHEIEELTTNNELQISRNVLQKGFRELFGSSLKNYQVQKRLEESRKLLEDARLNLRQIAFKCGYRRQGSFTRAFKELYGMTPSEWQEKITMNNRV